MAESNKDFVLGFISTRRVSEDPSLIHFTPGEYSLMIYEFLKNVDSEFIVTPSQDYWGTKLHNHSPLGAIHILRTQLMLVYFVVGYNYIALLGRYSGSYTTRNTQYRLHIPI